MGVHPPDVDTNGGFDKRYKSPAFHAGVTGSNPVAVTTKIRTAIYNSFWNF